MPAIIPTSRALRTLVMKGSPVRIRASASQKPSSSHNRNDIRMDVRMTSGSGWDRPSRTRGKLIAWILEGDKPTRC